MKIEVLSIAGCPHRAAAMAEVRAVVAAAGLSVAVQETVVNDEAEAQAQWLPGSPTVRINGSDVEASAAPPAMACRLYAGGRGVPATEMLRRALAQALAEERGNP